MICSKCRHENPGGNRFCGICGAKLRAPDVTVDPDAPSVRWLKAMEERKESEPPSLGAAGSADMEAAAREREIAARAERAARRERELARRAEADRARERETPSEPAAEKSDEAYSRTVGGPSFLGLNEGYSQPLEDNGYVERADIYSGGRSYSRALWLLLVLVVVAGLAYLQWRHSEGLQALPPAQKPPTPPADTVAETQETRQQETRANDPLTGNGQDQSAAGKLSSEAANPKATEASPDEAAKSQPAGDLKKQDQAAEPRESAAGDDAAPSSAKGKTSAVLRAAKEPLADESDEPVRLAEKYLLGRGVPQSCPTATNILREAANRGNYRAQIKLGALYATGNCVSLDRVQAYRFFTRALQSKPTNTWVEQNRSMLWAQMSDQERRQAMEQSF